VEGLADWPFNRDFLRVLSQRLQCQSNQTEPVGPVAYFWPGIIPRNVFFLMVVLTHGFRRLFPPY